MTKASPAGHSILHDVDGHGVTVDTRIYDLQAVKNAAYRIADRASVLIRLKGETQVEVIFISIKTGDHERVIGDFCAELLDQDLRAIIKKETAHVRNLILAHAFSRSSLVKQE
jgi:His-Xaa-Ser system protein HxsD